MVAVFDLTGSIDIVLNRLVSLAFGVVVVVLLFHICRRHWGTQVALGAALIAILLPTSVMNDASGMLEPLGVALILLSLWSWPRRGGFWAGLALGLATMARAEAWIFSLGMVVAAHLRREGSRQRVSAGAGFRSVMLIYMKVLADKTGNAIYPLWWNFFANAAGKWEFTPISASQAGVRPVLGVLLVGSVDRARMDPVEAPAARTCCSPSASATGFSSRACSALRLTWRAGSGGCRSRASSRSHTCLPACCWRSRCCGGRRVDTAGEPFRSLGPR